MITPRLSARSRREWNDAIQRTSGDLLQSWEWGGFKSGHGWSVERLHIVHGDGEALAQVLFRRRGPFVLGYLPRGPAWTDDQAAAGLRRALDELCIARRVALLVVDPDRPLPLSWTPPRGRFRSGPQSFQTPRTVKVALRDDEHLLAGMRRDTRSNIHHARRRGVEVDVVPAQPLATRVFYDLLQQTSRRGQFGIHGFAYYQDMLAMFGDDAALLLARAGGVVTNGLIVARCGDEARSMYAGASLLDRGRGDAALVRFAAMRWARDRGCTRYDLGGIAPVDPGVSGPDRSGLAGVDQFKIGFGGEIITFPSAVERPYRPLMAWTMRRFSPRFRPAAQ